MATTQTLREIRQRLEEIRHEVDRLTKTLVQVQKEHDEKKSAPETPQAPENVNEGPHLPGPD
jgi:hypothetical protein